MRRRRRTIRVLKWLGTLGCALVAGAFVAGGWWQPALGYRSAARQSQVFLHSDAIYFVAMEGWRSSKPDMAEGFFVSLDGAHFGSHFDYEQAHAHVAPSGIRIPLWIAFAVLLGLTVCFWRLDRRVPPGHCRKCRYDLTGNTSGRCPECGAEFSMASGA